MSDTKLLPCPFCGGEAYLQICDDEGNDHTESGYEENPWSGLGYHICHAHEKNPDCPIAKYAEDGANMGVWIYDSREDAIAAWNRRFDANARAEGSRG